MSTFVYVTFDLSYAPPEKYTDVKRDLARRLKLGGYVRSREGRHVRLPNNTYAGRFRDVKDNGQFADVVKKGIELIFKKNAVRGRAFILVSGAGWAWRVPHVL